MRRYESEQGILGNPQSLRNRIVQEARRILGRPCHYTVSHREGVTYTGLNESREAAERARVEKAEEIAEQKGVKIGVPTALAIGEAIGFLEDTKVVGLIPKQEYKVLSEPEKFSITNILSGPTKAEKHGITDGTHQ